MPNKKSQKSKPAQTKAQIDPKQGIPNQADLSSKREESHRPQAERHPWITLRQLQRGDARLKML